MQIGLQKRISFALTAVIVLFVAAQGYLAYTSLEQQEDSLVDDIVQSEARRLIGRIESGDTAMPAKDQPLRLGPNLVAWLVPGDAAAPKPPPPPDYLADLADGHHMFHRDGNVLHAVITRIPAGRLFVEFDATQNEEFVYRFGGYLIATGLLCIGVGWLISAFIARIVVAPFRRMSERLSSWSPGEAAGPAARTDEETMLLKAFDDAQRRLEESHVREREFAANVRHEVGTPLAALRTDAEMLLLTEDPSAAGTKRLRRMIAAVDSVSGGLDALNALSRAAAGRIEPVRLAQCVDDVWESLGHIASVQGVTLLNAIPEADTFELDRLALMTILRNLVRNVIDHAAPGECRVTRTAGGIMVADDGPGIAPEDRAFVFDRYFRGRLTDSPGIVRQDRGLGLAIARQTAELAGWTLELEPAAARGAAFSLKFD
jgi:signal transduction histidine kinase